MKLSRLYQQKRYSLARTMNTKEEELMDISFKWQSIVPQPSGRTKPIERQMFFMNKNKTVDF